MRANLDKKPAEIAAMFDQVASRYDLLNTLSSLGQDRMWRRHTARAVVPQLPRPESEAEPYRVLDVACGTGTSAASYAERGAEVTGVDISPGMLEQARRRYPQIDFQLADATKLPFADESFDCLTISYGLRNVQDPERALQEFYRVTKPGGRLVIAEFSRPTNRIFRAVYHAFLGRGIPLIARILRVDPAPYVYLGESILAWPSQSQLGRQISRAGWQSVAYRNLSGGIVALHRGIKP